MADNTYLARGYTFEVKNASDTYVEIGGVDNWTPSDAAVDADTTTFDDDGNTSHVKASRSFTVTLAGKQISDDTGQAEVISWAKLKGPDSLRDFRITDPDGNTKVFKASATYTVGGGGTDGVSTFSIAVTRSGATTDSTLGSALSAPTSVAGTSAVLHSVISFTQSGTAEVYEVQILSGASVVEAVRATEKPIYVPLTAGSYTAKARSYNANGWSALSTASSSFTVSAS